MKISIVSPKELLSQREYFLEQAYQLIARQERSCLRYRRELLAIRNKIDEINKALTPRGV